MYYFFGYKYGRCCDIRHCKKISFHYIGCSFKFILKVGVEESIMNAPLVSLQNKNTNNSKSEVRFKQLIRGAFTIGSSKPTLRINLNEHPI
jgi:hypothetical protein